MMDDNNTEAIWNFGKEVVAEERDNTIEMFINFCNLAKNDPFDYVSDKESGLMHLFIKLAKSLNLDEKTKKAIIALFIDTLDGFINNVFWNFEQSNGKYKIVTQDKTGQDFDIVTESDGLCTGQWEFIDRYSKYNTAEDMLRTGEIEKKPEEE